MLDLLQILGLLLEVFGCSILAVTSAVVLYALLQWRLDRRHSPRLTS
jgi:hypothetical protein